MDYDVVLATRNRQAILRVSVPLILSQSRQPRRFIVADSSDDHNAVRAILHSAHQQTRSNAELIIVRSEAGTALQRNLGLDNVTSPVVIFPDDDSLWFRDSADSLMRVYERDEKELVGCVAFTASQAYPPGSFGSAMAPFQLEFRDRLSQWVRRIWGTFEDSLVPDPMLGGQWMRVWGVKVPPVWLMEEDTELCGPVAGYRMSFRTSAIRGVGGFDCHLGKYAMFEDSDATIATLQQYLNVVSHRARVHHYRVPGQRLSGWEFGMSAVLNRVYIVCKHAPADAPARRFVRQYLRYKLLRYALQSYSAYGRQRLKGALYAMSRVMELLGAPADQLATRYLAIRTTACDGALSRPQSA